MASNPNNLPKFVLPEDQGGSYKHDHEPPVPTDESCPVFKDQELDTAVEHFKAWLEGSIESDTVPKAELEDFKRMQNIFTNAVEPALQSEDSSTKQRGLRGLFFLLQYATQYHCYQPDQEVFAENDHNSLTSLVEIGTSQLLEDKSLEEFDPLSETDRNWLAMLLECKPVEEKKDDTSKPVEPILLTLGKRGAIAQIVKAASQRPVAWDEEHDEPVYVQLVFNRKRLTFDEEKEGA